MPELVWQTKSAFLYECMRDGQLGAAANGGNAYDYSAYMALKGKYQIRPDEQTVYQDNDNYFNYLWRLNRYKPEECVVISEPYPIAFGKYRRGTYRIGMVHHIDPVLSASTFKHKWYFSRLEKKLKDLDIVVTVSGFWKNYLSKIGCKNISVIYNSFEPAKYIRPEHELESFRKKHNLDSNVPLVYIGNASREKGVYDSYKLLKDHPYRLVMTGASNRAPDLPVTFYNLNQYDYVTLLNCCNVVLTMSHLIEGWNRVAHEAMLCGVPVIGTGTGGMRELLEGGGQCIVEDWNDLSAAVEECLDKTFELGKKGRMFVLKYDEAYFRNEWHRLIDNI